MTRNTERTRTERVEVLLSCDETDRSGHGVSARTELGDDAVGGLELVTRVGSAQKGGDGTTSDGRGDTGSSSGGNRADGRDGRLLLAETGGRARKYTRDHEERHRLTGPQRTRREWR